MKLGHLVTLKEHCRKSDRLAMVIEMDVPLGRHYVRIVFLDDMSKTVASKNNLEVVSEGR